MNSQKSAQTTVLWEQ